MQDVITVLAPAKVNLALEVLGLRPDGYHELDMLMQAVTLYETVTLQKQPAGVLTLRCHDADGAPAAGVPADSRNIAHKAAAAFFAATGIAGGVAIDIQKNVPAQAGMAGGSADAAGVLWGLDQLYAAGLSDAALCRIGAGIGSDVPFCLTGGAARVGGRGERIARLPSLPDCFLVAVMPPVGSSTPQGFARYDAWPHPIHPDIDAGAAALRRGDLAAVCRAAANALQAPCATADTHTILAALRQAGADAALLTGTGAVCYGIFQDGATAAAAAAALAPRWPQVFLLQPEARGPFTVDA